jgi:hypothetical protein
LSISIAPRLIPPEEDFWRKAASFESVLLYDREDRLLNAQKGKLSRSPIIIFIHQKLITFNLQFQYRGG